MQRTTNYGLCQYEGSDKTSYLVNYNDDMLKIDTAIKGAADGASAAQTKADTADGKADTNAGNISTLNTQINGEGGIAADLGTVQGAVQTITSLIGNGEPTTTDKTLIGAINELNTNEGTLSSLTTTEKSNLVGAINEINAEVTKLPNTYVYKEFEQTVQVSADGVKTYATLLSELITAVNATIATLGDSELIEIAQIWIGNNGNWQMLNKHSVIAKNGQLPNFESNKIQNDGTNTTFYYAYGESTAANSVIRRTVINNTSGTVTYTDRSSDVPSNDVTLKVIYHILKKI